MNKSEDTKLKKHHDRDDLVGEHKYGDLGQLILFFVFIAVWITDSFILNISTWLAQYIPLYFRLGIALPVFIFSFILAQRGLKTVFGEIRDKPEVISKGVFSRMRHPIYLAAILFYFSFCISTVSVASFVTWLIIIFFYNYIAGYEEKMLIKHLGSDYKNYILNVRRWGI